MSFWGSLRSCRSRAAARTGVAGTNEAIVADFLFSVPGTENYWIFEAISAVRSPQNNVPLRMLKRGNADIAEPR